MIVVFVLGALLTFFGGSVQRPVFKINEQGERERVFRELPNGDREPVMVVGDHARVVAAWWTACLLWSGSFMFIRLGVSEVINEVGPSVQAPLT